MAQDELVLKIPSEETNHLRFNEHHEAAANLNLVSQVLKNKSKTRPDASRGQTHSRESSGTSNLSVKFTIEREVGGSSPSVTESVSVCSSPQDLSPNTNFGVHSKCSKPPLVPCIKKGKSKKRRPRKSDGSSGQDSGALSGNNSANEDYSNAVLSEDGSLEDEGTTMDELSDEGNRHHLCSVNESEAGHLEENDSWHAPSSSVSHQNQYSMSDDRTENTDICKNNSNKKGEHYTKVVSTPSKTSVSVTDSKDYASEKIVKRYVLKSSADSLKVINCLY